MSKIYGDQNTINKAKQAPAGDKSVYINWDAINEMPEEFEVVVTEVKFNPKKLDESFTNVGSDRLPAWFPKTELMYKVAEACGISGGDASNVAPLTEEVDINPMLRKSIEDAPAYRRMTVGRSVSKRSSRLAEDGTLVWSSLCTHEYNVWERCVEMWSKEEMYTNGYTKAGKYPNKYENRYQRKSNFDSEMKFAHAKAETKAYVNTIRELAGMPTGYNSQDLASGSLIFSKVRRSKKALQLESAARLNAISLGIGTDGGAMKSLFGPSEDEPVSDTAIEEVETVEESEIVAVFHAYIGEIEDADLKAKAEKTLAWLENAGPDPKAKSASYYGKAVHNLKEIEAALPEMMRIKHNIY
jgi:hypothetical protein